MTSITTIIPTYRRPQLLRRAIRSVLAQSYSDLQVCVYDNASGDETSEVVQELACRDARVKYHRHERNIGMLPNFVFGLTRVESPFFNILSDDDVLLPYFFETGIGALKSNAQAKWFAGLLVGADQDGEVKRLKAPHSGESMLPPAEIFGCMARNWHTWTAMIFRAEVLASAGGLDPDVGPDADVDFVLRIAALHPAMVSAAPCAIAMDHSGSTQRTKAQMFDVATGLKRIVRNIRAVTDSERVDARARRAMTAALRRWMFETGLVYVIRGEKDAAVAASERLTEDLKAPARAAVLRLLIRDSMTGTAARDALLAARRIIRAWRTVSSCASARNRHYQGIELADTVRRAVTADGRPDSSVVAGIHS